MNETKPNGTGAAPAARKHFDLSGLAATGRETMALVKAANVARVSSMQSWELRHHG